MNPLLPSLSSLRGQRAITVGAESLSYSSLDEAAQAHVARLREEGVQPGDRVALWATPDLPTVVALVGQALAGVATIPLNPALGEREIEHVLADAAPKLVLASRPDDHRAQTPTVQPIRLDGPRGAAWVAGGREPEPDDPLFVLYTSGTTGRPKGAVLTYRNAASNLDALAAAWGWTAQDRLVHALPIFHVHGLVLGIFGSLRVQGELVLLPRFSPEAVCAAMGAGGTMLFAVPTMHHRISEHLEKEPLDAQRLSRARLLVSGSAALPVYVGDRLAARLGQRVVERYGLTETLINCAQTHGGPRTPGTVGPPLPGVELRLVDDERRPIPGGPVAPGQDPELGEIAVRGPNVFAGYLNQPEATARAMDADGFFYTGDLAHLTPDGEVRVVGRRATDLIKTGGFKVGAGEVEGALLEHPEVREAAVIGVPDEDLGERIIAFVVPVAGATPSAEALADHVARLLAPHKRPRAVTLLAELPRNAMGKLLKRQLR